MAKSPLTLIKKFFIERISELGSGYREHDGASVEDIGKTRINKAYLITPGEMSLVNQNLYNVQFQVTLFFEPGRDVNQSYFDGYEQALALEKLCLDAEAVGNADVLSGLIFKGITPEKGGDFHKFEINFNVLGIFEAN